MRSSIWDGFSISRVLDSLPLTYEPPFLKPGMFSELSGRQIVMLGTTEQEYRHLSRARRDCNIMRNVSTEQSC